MPPPRARLGLALLALLALLAATGVGDGVPRAARPRALTPPVGVMRATVGWVGPPASGAACREACGRPQPARPGAQHAAAARENDAAWLRGAPLVLRSNGAVTVASYDGAASCPADTAGDTHAGVRAAGASQLADGRACDSARRGDSHAFNVSLLSLFRDALLQRALPSAYAGVLDSLRRVLAGRQSSAAAQCSRWVASPQVSTGPAAKRFAAVFPLVCWALLCAVRLLARVFPWVEGAAAPSEVQPDAASRRWRGAASSPDVGARHGLVAANHVAAAERCRADAADRDALGCGWDGVHTACAAAGGPAAVAAAYAATHRRCFLRRSGALCGAHVLLRALLASSVLFRHAVGQIPYYSTLFTTNTTYTVPSYAGNYVSAVCIGGGGGGGGGASGSGQWSAGGGGGLAYVNNVFVVPNVTVLTIVVGAGGVGGNGYPSSAVNGTDGGVSFILLNGTTVVVSAAGGGGGKQLASGAGGCALVGTGFCGGAGGYGTNYAGGGGAAGYSGNGGVGCAILTGSCAGTNGAGGGGGGGGASSSSSGFQGGGVGMLGVGNSGAGASGAQGTAGSALGGSYYGGGGADQSSPVPNRNGVQGACRVVWGSDTSFPSAAATPPPNPPPPSPPPPPPSPPPISTSSTRR